MRVAALYDIHGNLPALEAVLAELPAAEVDAAVVGGDVVPGPMPVETLARLTALAVPVYYLRGNGDRVVAAASRGEDISEVPESARGAVHANAAALGHDACAVLDAWPATVRLRVRGLGEALFCHASPRNDRDIFTRRTADERLAALFAGVPAELVVCGHTHMPFVRRLGALRLVNAGSVGMPFGEAGADWVILGPDVEPRHTRYDLEAAAARIRASGYPDAAAFAANHVLQPPREQPMLEAFARVEVR